MAKTTQGDNISDPFALNIQGVTDLVSNKTNKMNGSSAEAQEGAQGEGMDTLELSMTDDELLLLANKWRARYSKLEGQITTRQQINLKYYKGFQDENSAQTMDGGGGIASNVLFESEETFLAAALANNPDPVVYSDNSPLGNEVSQMVQTMLQYHATALSLRRKFLLMVRKWSLDFLGVIKYGWDAKINDIKVEVRDVKNFIFDPNGYVDVNGNFNSYLGEKITVSAERLIEMFPKSKSYVLETVENKVGTDVTYTEWWTDEFVFYTYKDMVLDKHKNPHFNYEDKEGALDEARNHFSIPLKPYTFLSVFNIQDGPFDITGLLEQNITNQRLITKRTRQLDFNLTRANNTIIFSEENFNQETGKQAAQAWQKGHPVLVPKGRPIAEAVQVLNAPSVPAAFFDDLENTIERTRSIFGVQGITAQKGDEDQTARGMILNQQYDNSRIGGGIGDCIEQVARTVFNWLVQLYYVYYNEPHYAAVMGQLKASEWVVLSQIHLNARLIVTVSPNSMKPRDPISKMNQALSLYEQGALDPLTLLTVLDFPNPKETVASTMLYKLDPRAYFILNFPEEAQKAGMIPPQQTGEPPQGGLVPPTPEAPPPEVGGVPATAALSNVPINQT